MLAELRCAASCAANTDDQTSYNTDVMTYAATTLAHTARAGRVCPERAKSTAQQAHDLRRVPFTEMNDGDAASVLYVCVFQRCTEFPPHRRVFVVLWMRYTWATLACRFAKHDSADGTLSFVSEHTMTHQDRARENESGHCNTQLHTRTSYSEVRSSVWHSGAGHCVGGWLRKCVFLN